MTEQADGHASGTVNSHPNAPAALRLLPWPTPEGKPCYLVTDNNGGYLSHLADDLEAAQLATGADVLDRARRVLDDPMSPHAEVRYAGIRLAECLTDALRVAESRGMRLVVPDRDEEDDGIHGQAARNARSGLWS
ncbi:hypothetical protein EDD90_4753 [Streptomyces sp. Ag109_O5-1]|uniref:hypothetical protein n=1 Tax=Streptomyces sp. Ag109_O5-1 TaxID=1938851 RepID=UPI000FB36981|nr:hypothetical protein [Streptomyces sp. Ag109_O5-1]RPE41662.1 hypothetical protein EDD90_4753 [Streptomyces sp. Ag109_O5-1]